MPAAAARMPLRTSQDAPRFLGAADDLPRYFEEVEALCRSCHRSADSEVIRYAVYYTDESSWDAFAAARDSLEGPKTWQEFKTVVFEFYPQREVAHTQSSLQASLPPLPVPFAPPSSLLPAIVTPPSPQLPAPAEALHAPVLTLSLTALEAQPFPVPPMLPSPAQASPPHVPAAAPRLSPTSSDCQLLAGPPQLVVAASCPRPAKAPAADLPTAALALDSDALQPLFPPQAPPALPALFPQVAAPSALGLVVLSPLAEPVPPSPAAFPSPTPMPASLPLPQPPLHLPPPAHGPPLPPPTRAPLLRPPPACIPIRRPPPAPDEPRRPLNARFLCLPREEPIPTLTAVRDGPTSLSQLPASPLPSAVAPLDSDTSRLDNLPLPPTPALAAFPLPQKGPVATPVATRAATVPPPTAAQSQVPSALVAPLLSRPPESSPPTSPAPLPRTLPATVAALVPSQPHPLAPSIPPAAHVPLIRPPPVPDDALPVTDSPLAPLAKTHPLPTVATVPLHSSGPAMRSLQPLLLVARSTSSAASSAPLPTPMTTISPLPMRQLLPLLPRPDELLPLLDDRAFYLLRGGSVTMPAVARNIIISPVSKLTPVMPEPSPPVPLLLPSRASLRYLLLLPDNDAIQLRWEGEAPAPAVTCVTTGPPIPLPVAQYPLPLPSHTPPLRPPPMPDDQPLTPYDRSICMPRGGSNLAPAIAHIMPAPTVPLYPASTGRPHTPAAAPPSPVQTLLLRLPPEPDSMQPPARCEAFCLLRREPPQAPVAVRVANGLSSRTASLPRLVTICMPQGGVAPTPTVVHATNRPLSLYESRQAQSPFPTTRLSLPVRPNASPLLRPPEVEVSKLPGGGFVLMPAATHIVSALPTPSPAAPDPQLVSIPARPPPWPNIADIATLPMSVIRTGAPGSALGAILNAIASIYASPQRPMWRTRTTFQVF